MPEPQKSPYALNDPRVLADPHPLLHRMRRDDPVHWSEQLQAWVLTRYEDVCLAFRDPRLSNRRMDLLVRHQLRHGDPTLARDFERVLSQQMLFQDGA
jgi:cytochrome P450